MNISNYNNPVADNIANAIQAKGIKQYVIAGKAGFTAQHFNDMLNGRRVIKACDIPRIADALDLTPNDLYGISTRAAKNPAN